MTYTKPELLVLESASTAIAHYGGFAKPEDVVDAISIIFILSSAFAYEIDE
jgi:hypothetical protein